MIKDRIQQLDGQLSGDAVSIEEAGKQAETAKEQYAVLESLRDVNTALTETKHLIEVRDFQKYANRDFKNALYDLAGHAMIPVLVRLSGIPEDTKVNTSPPPSSRTCTQSPTSGLMPSRRNFPLARHCSSPSGVRT